jgi:anaerobic selenocysteine-containing dehydrogenase
MASRMGTPIRVGRQDLPLDSRPSKEEVIACLVERSRVPFAEIREHEGGHVYTDVTQLVEPADPDCEARLQLAPEGVCEELREVLAEPQRDGFSHRLISRRLRHVYNSSGRDVPELRKKGTTNPAFMNPEDMRELGIANGAVVEISSAHASILGVAERAPDVPAGVVSMAHAWGDPAADPKEVRETGSSTNRLVDDETGFDPITGMARQSALPVNIRLAPHPP